MSDEQENHDETTDPKGLRAAVEAANKRAKDAEDRAAAAEKAITDRNVKDFLTAKNVNPKVANLIPADVSQDAAKLESWFTENADVFGAPAGQTEGVAAEPTQPDPVHDAKAWNGVTAASAATGQPEKNDPVSRLKALDIKPSTTPEEVWAKVREVVG